MTTHRPDTSPSTRTQSLPATALDGASAPGRRWAGSPDDIPAAPPHFGQKEDGSGRRVLVACAMMEDEVRAAYDKHGRGMQVTWIDRGYHENPNVLREKLQEAIDEVEADGAGEVLLAIGLCGNGVVGLRTRHAVLAMPRFDDCVNLMLCKGARTCRGLARAGVMYLTRGWSKDATMITGQREYYVRKYGERRANRLMEAMYGAYTAVSLIDNGCYDLNDVQDYAHACADALGVEVKVDPGSNEVLDKLLSGDWDADILVKGPGQPIGQEDFDFASYQQAMFPDAGMGCAACAAALAEGSAGAATAHEVAERHK